MINLPLYMVNKILKWFGDNILLKDEKFCTNGKCMARYLLVSITRLTFILVSLANQILLLKQTKYNC